MRPSAAACVSAARTTNREDATPLSPDDTRAVDSAVTERRLRTITTVGDLDVALFDTLYAGRSTR